MKWFYFNISRAKSALRTTALRRKLVPNPVSLPQQKFRSVRCLFSTLARKAFWFVAVSCSGPA